jgi:hypothetical protein
LPPPATFPCWLNSPGIKTTSFCAVPACTGIKVETPVL